jgi:hypothetical protein
LIGTNHAGHQWGYYHGKKMEESGDEVTDIRKDGIVMNIFRGNRRVGTDGHIHSTVAVIDSLEDDVYLTDVDFLLGALLGWR